MSFLSIEVKAKTKKPEEIKGILEEKSARFEGEDHQVDTYFKTNVGRLKLREGNIENYLIFYKRDESGDSMESKVSLFKTEPNDGLKEILEKTNGIKVVVDKRRMIYFIKNIKFHIDNVKNLGSFVEIEAQDKEGVLGEEKLKEQLREYKEIFGIEESDIVRSSYSDLI